AGATDLLHLPTRRSSDLGQRGLVLLRIDPGRLVSRVVYENASGGTENFPHVYGPLNVEAVERVFRFEPGADGTFDHQRIMLALRSEEHTSELQSREKLVC